MRKIALLENEATAKTFVSTIYRSYKRSREMKLKKLDFHDIIWERDYDAIYTGLKTLGIKKITISDQSTALMRTLAAFQDRGAYIGHIVKIQTGMTIDNVDGRIVEVPDITPAINLIIK